MRLHLLYACRPRPVVPQHQFRCAYGDRWFIDPDVPGSKAILANRHTPTYLSQKPCATTWSRSGIFSKPRTGYVVFQTADAPRQRSQGRATRSPTSPLPSRLCLRDPRALPTPPLPVKPGIRSQELPPALRPSLLHAIYRHPVFVALVRRGL